MNLHCYFLFLYYYIILYIASLLLAFYTISSYSVMFFCPNRQRTLSSSRGLSIHCYTCNNDNNYIPLPSSSTKSQGNKTKHHLTYKTPINDILQNMSYTKKNLIQIILHKLI